MVGNVVRIAEGIVRKGMGMVAGLASRVAGEPPDDDAPLIDPAEAKAVRSESEVLRQAARRSPG